MTDRFDSLDRSPRTNNVISQAADVITGMVESEDTEETLRGFLKIITREQQVESTTEKIPPQFYELEEDSRNNLLYNLGLRPTDRNTIHDEHFFANHYMLLQSRLKELAGSVFGDIHRANPVLYAQMSNLLGSVSNHSRVLMDDISIGMALAIEAYRLDTNLDIVAGFSHINDEAESRVMNALSVELPSLQRSPLCFSPPIIREAAMTAPIGAHQGLIDDIHLIGKKTVEGYPMAMRLGGRAMVTALGEAWEQFDAAKLLGYEPSGYNDTKGPKI